MKKMSNSFVIPMPENFSFRQAVTGHGWYDLAPFEYDEALGTLSYTHEDRRVGKCQSFTMAGEKTGIRITGLSRSLDRVIVEPLVRHMVRADEEFDAFYSAVAEHPEFSWVVKLNGGRLLRSGTVFEDLVKSLCTTNCSWALTRIMTKNLVESLGKKASNGRRAFPSANALASVSETFFRDEVRAGYRSPYFVELSDRVASGDLDPETWLTSELPTPELKKEIKKVKGVGDYAAENLLKLIGRYDGLALDSWLRGGFFKKHNREKQCSDKKIEKHYRKFGEWKGLAIWCDMTRSWFDGQDNLD